MGGDVVNDGDRDNVARRQSEGSSSPPTDIITRVSVSKSTYLHHAHWKTLNPERNIQLVELCK